MKYEGIRYPVRDELAVAHEQAWQSIARPGTWWTGADRIAMVAESRSARHCTLCSQRKSAVSPYSIEGNHDRVSTLPRQIIEVIHRVSTDPGRLTRNWFNGVIESGVSMEEYIEVLSVVATSIMIDTFHRSLGMKVPALPEAKPGNPSRIDNENVVEGGAWVPLMPADLEASATGLPSVPNIVRAMSLVPDAVSLYFGVERSHYTTAPMDIAITRDQTEFVAARVSALNQYFY